MPFNPLPNKLLHSQPLSRLQLAIKCHSLPYRQLGSTDVRVSSLCLGTMLFGEGTDRVLAHRILSAAADAGVNFWESAEMYPVPQSSSTQGASELILGEWLKGHRRSDFVVATKVAGPGGMEWIRGGPASLGAKDILGSIEGSLKRLQTDYIDLIQLHWPDRYVPMFGEVDFDPSMAYRSVPFEEQLEALQSAISAGKVRHYGLSNETPWGLMKFCSVATSSTTNVSEEGCGGLPRPVSLQNAYSLTCRSFDSGLAECCHAERVSLLAYSPLAMGLLTGKYLAPGGGPPGARLNKYKGRYAEAESRYGPKPNVREAVAQYAAVAGRWGISPTELAIRFVVGHPLVGAAVTGVTDEGQLAELVAAAGKPLLEEKLRREVDAVHAKYPNPTP